MPETGIHQFIPKDVPLYHHIDMILEEVGNAST